MIDFSELEYFANQGHHPVKITFYFTGGTSFSVLCKNTEEASELFNSISSQTKDSPFFCLDGVFSSVNHLVHISIEEKRTP